MNAVAECLGPIFVSLPRDERIEFAQKLGIYRNTDATQVSHWIAPARHARTHVSVAQMVRRVAQRSASDTRPETRKTSSSPDYSVTSRVASAAQTDSFKSAYRTRARLARYQDRAVCLVRFSGLSLRWRCGLAFACRRHDPLQSQIGHHVPIVLIRVRRIDGE